MSENKYDCQKMFLFVCICVVFCFFFGMTNVYLTYLSDSSGSFEIIHKINFHLGMF